MLAGMYKKQPINSGIIYKPAIAAPPIIVYSTGNLYSSRNYGIFG